MLTVHQYRKVGKKQKKLRSWVLIALALLFSFIITLITYEIIKKLEKQKVHEVFLNNVLIKEKEMILKVNSLDYPLSKDIEKLRETAKKFKISYFTAYYGTEPIIKASFTNPEVIILNGKGEKNLAMNLSVILVTNNINVVNYGNATKEVENSFILLRAPISEEYTKKISLLTGITNLTISLSSIVIPPTTAPIVIVLGKNYNLKN